MKKSTIWLLGIIGFILICFCCLFFKVPSMQDDLISRSNLALVNAGITVDSLSINGRDITLSGIVPSIEAKENAEKIVREIWGVNTVYNNLQVLEKPKQVIEQPEQKNVEIQKKLDEVIELENIQFENGRSTIKTVSYPILDKVFALLNDYPEINISVNGHTDSRGNPASNKKLSLQRAESVKDYLVKNGINKNRITAKGFGSTQPIADNNTAEGRQKNRRVEFKIIQEN